jgi:chromosome segregation ATPase
MYLDRIHRLQEYLNELTVNRGSLAVAEAELKSLRELHSKTLEELAQLRDQLTYDREMNMSYSVFLSIQAEYEKLLGRLRELHRVYVPYRNKMGTSTLDAEVCLSDIESLLARKGNNVINLISAGKWIFVTNSPKG